MKDIKIEELDGRLEVEKEVIEQRDMRFSEEKSILKSFESLEEDIDLDDTIIFLSKKDSMFEINLTGALIYEQIIHKKRFADIAMTLKQYFGDDGIDILNEVKVFVNKLYRHGIFVECKEIKKSRFMKPSVDIIEPGAGTA